MDCPECGAVCGRDSADVGVGTIYGPYGCACGWSEDDEYSHSDNPHLTPWGEYVPEVRTPRQLANHLRWMIENTPLVECNICSGDCASIAGNIPIGCPYV